MIHPSAIVDASARLAEDVEVGPGAIIDAGVSVGAGTRIGARVVIRGPAAIGANNRIFPFNSLGEEPQDKKFRGESTRLEIGDDNVIREFCTFNRGTRASGVTRLGDRNWIMAYAHIAHDCRVGSDIVMANGTTLAGHVEVGDWAAFGAFSMVHQFCAIGAHSFSAMGTVILKDVPPYVTVAGNFARAHGLNREGLKRRGYRSEQLRTLKRAYRIVYRQGKSPGQAVAALAELAEHSEEVRNLREFLLRSKRGIVRSGQRGRRCA